jgi:D-glycero-alpha-D-manno-heptose-7-phosphate kinase
MSVLIKEILERCPVEASAPCRVDSGGTWDIKSLALPLESLRPTTINIALNLRTHVRLSPCAAGRVGISSEGFSLREEHACDRLPFNSPFGLFFAAVSYFGFHGLKIHICADSPVKSALGGSSTALVSLIKALSKVSIIIGGKKWTRGKMLHLGYHLEDGVSRGKCGIQDQAAAVYGGVHRWLWCYGDRGMPARRKSLLDRKGQRELSRHLLVAFSGKSHVSSRINRKWIDQFLSGKTRSGWMKVNGIVQDMEEAFIRRDWPGVARLLREEMGIRREITPDAMIPLTEKLIDQAENAGCGARFAGAGAGGSVWAIGEKEKLQRLHKIWEETLSPIKKAGILPCAVDPAGVR